MGTRRQTGQTRGTRRLVTLLAAGSFGLGLTLLTGCSQTPTTAAGQPHDPLHGVLTPPGGIPQPTGMPKTPGTPTSLTPRSSNQGVAPIGSELSSTNNATLAGLSGPGPLGRPLAIDDQGRTLPPVQRGYPAPNANPKVEQVPDLNPTPPKLTPSSWQTEQPITPGVQPANPAGASNEIFTRQLQDRGVVNSKIDQLSEGVHLTCYVSRGPNGGLRILELTAVDYATAAQAILQQLDGAR